MRQFGSFSVLVIDLLLSTQASIISPSENLLDLKLLDTNLKVLEMMGESAENDSMLLSHRLKKISE